MPLNGDFLSACIFVDIADFPTWKYVANPFLALEAGLPLKYDQIAWPDGESNAAA